MILIVFICFSIKYYLYTMHAWYILNFKILKQLFTQLKQNKDTKNVLVFWINEN